MAMAAVEHEAPSMPEIVVSVGTDHHRFDRLIRWSDDYARQNPDRLMLVQRGTSNEPQLIDSQELIPHGDLRAFFAAATVVVCHGGPSTVMDARAAGRLPIVVPRNPELDEHVDGHQMRFARHLDDEAMAIVAWTEGELFAALDAALADPASVTIPIEERSVPTGVVNFGRVVDELLSIETPIATVVGPDRFAKKKRRLDR